MRLSDLIKILNFAVQLSVLMKKILFLIFCMITITAFAQSSKAYLELNTGLSLPVFTYSSNNLESGCFTQPGFTVSAETGIWLYKKWGFSILSGLQLHSVDVGLLGWEKIQADPFLKDLYIRSDPYRIIHIMAGPEYAFQIIDKLELDIQILAGVFFSRTPYQLYKPTYYMVGPEYYEITSSKDISFAYGGGLRLNYAITPCYDLSLKSDLLTSNAAFDFSTSTGIRTEYRTISMVNISVGLVLHLF